MTLPAIWMSEDISFGTGVPLADDRAKLDSLTIRFLGPALAGADLVGLASRICKEFKATWCTVGFSLVLPLGRLGLLLVWPGQAQGPLSVDLC